MTLIPYQPDSPDDVTILDRKWFNDPESPESGQAPWVTLMQRVFPTADGLSLSLSVLEQFRGRLSARVFYTDKLNQVIECDFVRQGTIWVPGNSFILQARVECPIDQSLRAYNDRFGPPLVPPTSANLNATVVPRCNSGPPAQRPRRTYAFTNPQENIIIPVPSGAVSFSCTRTFLGKFTGNIERFYACVQREDFVPTYPADPEYFTQLADYSWNMQEVNVPSGAFHVVLPSSTSHLIATPAGRSGDPIIYKLEFEIEV